MIFFFENQVFFLKKHICFVYKIKKAYFCFINKIRACLEISKILTKKVVLYFNNYYC